MQRSILMQQDFQQQSARVAQVFAAAYPTLSNLGRHFVLQVHNNGEQRNVSVQLQEVHWRCILPQQLAAFVDRLAAHTAPARPAVAQSKRAANTQKQAQRREALAGMDCALFPFPQPSSGSASSSRRKQGQVSAPPFQQATLRMTQEIAPQRRALWKEAGVEEGIFDLLHPGGRGLAVKMCVADSARGVV